MPDKTEDEILEEIEDYFAVLFPRFKSMDPLTLHYYLSRALAHSIYPLYERIDEVLDQVDVLRATGEDLDHLVSSHLLVRGLGDKATGFIRFFRNAPAISPVTIPAGTVCKSGDIKLVTTAAGTILAGSVDCSVAAEAQERGIDGNVTAYTCNLYSSVADVAGAENPLAFSGGTEDESDDELRQRFIDIVTLPGLATTEMISRHLVDLEDITEASVLNYGGGDLEVIVDYSGGVTANYDDLVDKLEEVIAAGCQARGCHAAVATVGGNIAPVIDPVSGTSEDTYGGLVFVRALEPVLAEDTFDVDYVTMDGLTVTGSATVPKGTNRGEMVAITLATTTDRATSIPTKAFTGAYGYDVLIGMGEPNYLYELPTPVSISVRVVLVDTDTPEADLGDNIKASIEAWLSDYCIGENVEFSDIRNCCILEYDVATSPDARHVLAGTERVFVGVDKITSITVSSLTGSAISDGQEIALEADEIAKCGTVTVTVT